MMTLLAPRSINLSIIFSGSLTIKCTSKSLSIGVQTSVSSTSRCTKRASRGNSERDFLSSSEFWGKSAGMISLMDAIHFSDTPLVFLFVLKRSIEPFFYGFFHFFFGDEPGSQRKYVGIIVCPGNFYY